MSEISQRINEPDPLPVEIQVQPLAEVIPLHSGIHEFSSVLESPKLLAEPEVIVKSSSFARALLKTFNEYANTGAGSVSMSKERIKTIRYTCSVVRFKGK